MTNLRNLFLTISFIILGSRDNSICNADSNHVLNSGWVGRNNEEELNVYHRIGNATLSHYPPIPIKHSSVTFTCSVDDGGNKRARYRWLRNGKPVPNVVTPTWIIDSVNVYSRTNFSCFAYNDVDNGGAAAWEELMIYAPPRFIERLAIYQPALFSAPEISLTCRVECYPECQVLWFKDGVHIDEASDDHYFLKSNYMPADLSIGDFESVLSILNFNMSAWPGNKLDILRDNAIYSCESTDNAVGHGVRSTSHFVVNYPPENVTVTKSMVVLQDGSSIPKLKCSAKANPEPIFDWHLNGQIINSGSTLIIYFPVQKNYTEIYTCTAKNRHGSQTAEVSINGTSSQ